MNLFDYENKLSRLGIARIAWLAALTCSCKPHPQNETTVTLTDTGPVETDSDAPNTSVTHVTSSSTGDPSSSSATESVTTDTSGADTTGTLPDDGKDPTCGDNQGQAGIYCFEEVATAIERTPVRIGDFNYDGHQDILTQTASVQLEVWFGDGQGQFPSSSAFIVPPPWDAMMGFIAVGELDGIPGDDILSLKLLGDGVGDKGVAMTLKNNGTGKSFANVDQTVLDVNLYGGVEPGALIDLDGNATLDLLATASLESQPALKPFVNDGNGHFLTSFPSLSHEDFQACLVVKFASIAHVNGLGPGLVALPSSCNDPKPDDYPIQIIRSDGQGGVSYENGPLSGKDPRGLAAGDVSGDGLDDLITWTQGDRTFHVFEGLDTGKFKPLLSFQENEVCADCPCLNCMGTSDYVRVFAANLDGDSGLDVVAVGDSAHFGMQLMNSKKWAWIEAKPLLSGDFNEDGFTDFVARNGLKIEVLLSNP